MRYKALQNALWPTITALVLCLMLANVAAACPTCKDGLAEGGPGAANLIQGYFWSIVFMMSMPFLILSGLVLYFYYEVRRARAMRDEGRATESNQKQQPEVTLIPNP